MLCCWRAFHLVSATARPKKEDTAGASYQEYSIKKVEVDLKTTFYEAAGTDAWTGLKRIDVPSAPSFEAHGSSG